MFNFTQLPPLSLYIHVPWCKRKCPYCDFNSHAIHAIIPESDYVAALLADLEQDLPRIWGRTVRSIFIGGGTPSVLSPETICNLLSGVRARVSVIADAEITLEANPGTVDRERFCGFREAGINRLSLGIQSFKEKVLQSLGRIHGRKEAWLAIEAAKKAGFNQINLDMMFGLPSQSLEMALEDLQTAIAFQISHLSWYQLTLEPNTWFYHHPPSLPDDDLLWEIQTAGQDYLAKQGYFQYEVSAYAKPGQVCQHNLNYWKFGDYLGIGAGAHAKMTDMGKGTITRFSKQRHPETYLQLAHSSNVIANKMILTIEDVCLEFMMNALRLNKGFTNQEFIENTGLSITYVEKPMAQAYSRSWLRQKKEGAVQRIYATETGMQFLNELLELFL
jgi:oxygen-independent coproporphyrinogen-3 oxidase